MNQQIAEQYAGQVLDDIYKVLDDVHVTLRPGGLIAREHLGTDNWRGWALSQLVSEAMLDKDDETLRDLLPELRKAVELIEGYLAVRGQP